MTGKGNRILADIYEAREDWDDAPGLTKDQTEYLEEIKRPQLAKDIGEAMLRAEDLSSELERKGE
jgi:hypothetical protein